MNAHTPRILVVDDEPDIRRLVCEILEDEGYQVATAENAGAARELKKSKAPDLILLDIWMPDTDGITLLKEWVAEEAMLCPVVMMSGHGSVEAAVEATRLGAYDFLEKPLSLAKLLLIVERALEASSLQIENAGLKQQLVADIEPVGKSATVARTQGSIKATWLSMMPGYCLSARRVLVRRCMRVICIITVRIGTVPLLMWR